MTVQPIQSEIDVEQSLLGALLVNSEAFEAVDGLVTVDDFAEPLHRRLFEVFSAARSEGRRIDATLARSLMGDAALQKISPTLNVGGYLTELVKHAPSVLNAPDYARVIAEQASYRRIISTADHMRGRALLGLSGGTPAEIATEAITDLDAVHSGPEMRHKATLGQAMAGLVQSLDEPVSRRRGPTTGILALNNRLNGYVPGQLYVIAGRPGMGKSAFMCSSLRRTAEAGYGVAVFSLEMSAEEIAARCISDAWDDVKAPSFGSILRNDVFEHDKDRLSQVGEAFAEIPLHIDASPRLTFSQIAARARQVKNKLEADGRFLAVLCIDHMGLVTPSDRYRGNKVAEAGEVSAEARALAKELDCCVVLLCQLSREVEKRDDKRPVMADLRWSGEIEQDAHVVAFLYREAYYLAQDQAAEPYALAAARFKLDFLIRKNRNGETGDVRLWCSIAHSSVRDDL